MFGRKITPTINNYLDLEIHNHNKIRIPSQAEQRKAYLETLPLEELARNVSPQNLYKRMVKNKDCFAQAYCSNYCDTIDKELQTGDWDTEPYGEPSKYLVSFRLPPLPKTKEDRKKAKAFVAAELIVIEDWKEWLREYPGCEGDWWVETHLREALDMLTGMLKDFKRLCKKKKKIDPTDWEPEQWIYTCSKWTHHAQGAHEREMRAYLIPLQRR